MTGAARPPRFVPTLTEVVNAPLPGHGAAAAYQSGYAADAAPQSTVLTAQMQEALVQRVLERLDQTLTLRLREALATAAIEQSQMVARHMRSEIESVLTELVAQAVASELASRNNLHGGL